MWIFLPLSGALCVVVAVIHGYLGQAKLIPSANFATESGRLLVIAIWQLSTLVWIGSGITFAIAPWAFSDETRGLIVLIAALPIAYGVVANAWFTKGRHFGWMLLALVLVFAALGTYGMS